ncbi:MAG TPA: DUF58 domain-containing protein [Actinomycetota bacterium]|nr:DUF58 domain-containing protein [Actinomycetota bacterium]
MPTPRGAAVIIGGSLLLGAGWALGSEPMETLGFALMALAVIAAAVVLFSRHDLRITRELLPSRTHAHHPVTVSLKIENLGRGSAPLLFIEDRLPHGIGGTSRFAVSGIEKGGTRDASYTITPATRGRYRIGPLDVIVTDPFGLARVRSQRTQASDLLVHPTIEKLSLPRDLGERRTAAASALRQPTGPQGEDFYTLREYAEGDELRKIHWPSTAKRGKVMIRQEETPWHLRATILLDDRRRVHEGVGASASFERAVEAAAALVDLYHRSGYGFRLTTAHQLGITTSKGSEHYHRCLDLLATIETRGSTREEDTSVLGRLAEIEQRQGAEDTLVVLTGTIEAEVARALARCRRLYKQVVVLSWPTHRFAPTSTRARWDGEGQIVAITGVLARSGVRTIVLGPGDRLAPAWTNTRARGGDRTWGQKPELV